MRAGAEADDDAGCGGRQEDLAGALGRDAVPERGAHAWGLHPQGAGSFERIGISGEVVVADNGSTDGSQEIAEELERASCRSKDVATAPR